MKRLTLDDWQTLSEKAQEWEIAAYEYDREQKLEYLNTLEASLPRKDGKITAGETYLKINMARMDLF